VSDRRPVIGPHPVLKNIYVFNGLGTKGVLLSPFIAEQLYELMYNQIIPDKEVNIARFYHLFSNNLKPLP
jgi:glycine/D-amino acid oxidase-like deaminating enzyme